MNKKEIIEKFYETTEATYYRHKKQNRPVIQLIEKYFTENDLQEFLETGTIKRLEVQKMDEDFKDLILHDHMLNNAAFKLKLLSSGTYKMLEIFQDALSDIDPKDESYTIENSRQRLSDLILHIEKNSIFKTKAKIKGVHKWIENYFSLPEVHEITKHPKKMLKLLEETN